MSQGQQSVGLPTRWPWRQAVLAFVLLMMGLAGYARYRWWMTPLQRHYLPAYMKSGLMVWFDAKTGSYRLVMKAPPRGEMTMADDDEVVSGPTVVDRRLTLPIALSAAAAADGTRLVYGKPTQYDNRKLDDYLRHWIYGNSTQLEMIAQTAALGMLGCVPVAALVIAVRRRQAAVWRQGRRLRGPELVTTRQFNRRMKSVRGPGVHDCGIGILTRSRGWWQRVAGGERIEMLHVPPQAETSHILLAGASGSGKSSIIKQLLIQVEARGETAIIYDPHCEYVPGFLLADRGDIVLNPLDVRMPYWSPADEVENLPEALALAASLYPERDHDGNRFFIDAPRRIFAHLLMQRPTPRELVHWMAHPEEIDRLIRGTELQAFVQEGALAQRGGVQGSLNMVADALRLLPAEHEARGRWTAREWARERKGWIFLTSTATTREATRPLTSLWLDLLVLRLMASRDEGRPKTWFFLDELASLQRLPQLKTALTESRKYGNPIVLGFQGRNLLESIYGEYDAETILAQPATKVFLQIPEAKSARWMSEAIGTMEVERMRESRSDPRRVFDQPSHTESLERPFTPLVMDSEIMGLDTFEGFLKYRNLVVRLNTDAVATDQRAKGFIDRLLAPEVVAQPAPVKPALSASEAASAATPPSAVTVPAVVTDEEPFFE